MTPQDLHEPKKSPGLIGLRGLGLAGNKKCISPDNPEEKFEKYLKLIRAGFYVKCFRADFLRFLAQPSKFHF